MLILILVILAPPPAAGQEPSSPTGYLGIEYVDYPASVDETLAAKFGYPRGTIKIVRIPAGSPVDSVLTRRDYVVAINGQRLDEQGAFVNRLSQSTPGDHWTLCVHRLEEDSEEAKWLNITVVLGKHPTVD